jgi:Carboxypeptidase regulatory-like domain
MKRFLLALPVGLLLALALVTFAPTIGAAPAATGLISGIVVNGTHDNAVVASQSVVLRRGSGGAAQDVATTTTDSAGRFSFGNLPIGSHDAYVVFAEFQGGQFTSQSVTLDGGSADAVQLAVYDTTNDDANLHVSVATLLVRQPRPVNGLIGIGEIISIKNTGTTAFVGTPTGDASRPMRLLGFLTPPNASNLSLGIGFDGSQVFTTDKGFGATATVSPGTTEFAFAIDVPYTGTAADVAYIATYPTDRVVVLIPPDMAVNGQDFAAQGLVDSVGSRYQLFTVASLGAKAQASLRLTSLPRAGQASNFDPHALLIFAIILAALALLLLLIYVRRGNIAVALRLVPASAALPGESAVLSATHSNGANGGDDAEERERLLRGVLELERGHASGAVTDADFRQRDGELRARLRDLLALHQTIVEPHALVSTVSTDSVSASEVKEQPEAAIAGIEEAASEQNSGGRR